MRALDLFCGAGGAAMGLHSAGFDVIGVDRVPQPKYPFTFVQADALELPFADLSSFDLIWASPPCQAYSRSNLTDSSKHPDLLAPTRALLKASRVAWIIENVPGAPMRADAMLCGSMFGLGVRRHRWFEISSGLVPMTPPCDHSYPVCGVYGRPSGGAGKWPTMLPDSLESWSDAMGIDWMDTAGLSQAIPPAYSEYLARAFLEQLT